MNRLSELSPRPVSRTVFRISTVLRLLLGLIYALAGVNGFFLYFGLEPFLPKSPEAIELLGTGYLLVMEKGVELLFGLLLLTGRFTSLALLTLFPITANIVAFHLFVDPQLLLSVIMMALAHLYLLWLNRERYTLILQP